MLRCAASSLHPRFMPLWAGQPLAYPTVQKTGAAAYNVIDADGHILEPFDLWNKYTDPKHRDQAPRLVEDANGKRRLIIEERALGDPQRGFGSIVGVGARQGDVKATELKYEEGRPGGFDPHKRIPDMDLDGIDAA